MNSPRMVTHSASPLPLCPTVGEREISVGGGGDGGEGGRRKRDKRNNMSERAEFMYTVEIP